LPRGLRLCQTDRIAFAGDHLTADFTAQSYGGRSKAAIAPGHP